MNAIERAKRYLEKVPPAVAGQGGHNQTFAAAAALVHGFALGDSDAFDLLLRDYNPRCQPPWSERELVHKVQSAAAAQHTKPRGHLLGDSHPAPPISAPRPAPAKPTKKPITPEIATANVEKYLAGFRCTEADIRAASPCKLPPLIQLGGAWWHRQGSYLLSQLFEDGERANIVSNYKLDTDGKARPGDAGISLDQNDWQGRLLEPLPPSPAGAWLRMNPLDGQGIADANVTAFRLALVEIDSVPLDLQLPLLARLPIPVSAIIHSGGKSYHAWVRLDAANISEYRDATAKLLTLLAPFGVDNANKNPSRLSRLPGTTRAIGATGQGLQDLIYLDPHPEQKGIM